MSRQGKLLAIVTAGAVLVLLVMYAFASWHKGAEADLRMALRQYGELRGGIARYEELRKLGAGKAALPVQSLFSAVNEKSSEMGLERCIEALRPGVSQEKGVETLDLQMRGLYLAECMRWIEAMESIAGVRIMAITLHRNDKSLLDVSMRLARSAGGS